MGIKYERVQGVIRFSLDGMDGIKNEAINKACSMFKIPTFISSIQGSNPLDRAKKIGQSCQGTKYLLNSRTCIGNQICTGNKSKFWQKVLPILFEMVCMDRWEEMVESGVLAFDALLGDLKIDFKCKHREVSPYSDLYRYVATVPLYQKDSARKNVDFYVFGQMSKEMNEGFINGIMSMEDFWSQHSVKDRDDIDDNGEVYAEPMAYVPLTRVSRWIDDVDCFFPLKYRLELGI